MEHFFDSFWYYVTSGVAIVDLLQWYHVTSVVALVDFLLWYYVTSGVAVVVAFTTGVSC